MVVTRRKKPSRGASTHNVIKRDEAFAEVSALILNARQRALNAVNSALIDLYWQIGKTINRRIAKDGWGKGTVGALAAYIRSQHGGMRGFSPQNLWRMRQFYEAYGHAPKLSTLRVKSMYIHRYVTFHDVGSVRELNNGTWQTLDVQTKSGKRVLYTSSTAFPDYESMVDTIKDGVVQAHKAKTCTLPIL
jgi:hypothetical protein